MPTVVMLVSLVERNRSPGPRFWITGRILPVNAGRLLAAIAAASEVLIEVPEVSIIVSPIVSP
jgi:hypothetical protein